METLDKKALGNFALEFLDNLTNVDAESGEENDYYVAMFLVAGHDEAGDVEVLMQSTSVNGMVNVRVLQEAQLLQTKTMLMNVLDKKDDEDDAT